MSQHEKQAWFNVIVVALTVVTFLVLTFPLGAKHATGAFGFLGFLGIGPIFHRGKSPHLQADERDRAIQMKAGLIAYSVFWLCFVGGSLGVWSLYRDMGSIPVDILPLFPVIGVMVLLFTQSVVTLVQYGQGK